MAGSPSMQGEGRGEAQILSTREKTGVERLLRILAWEIGILLFFLAYLAFARPQPGRFQFVALQEGEVVLYDTATGRALYQKPELVPADGQPGAGETFPGEGG